MALNTVPSAKGCGTSVQILNPRKNAGRGDSHLEPECRGRAGDKWPLSGACRLASRTELLSSGSVKDPVLKDRDGANETASRVKAPAAKADKLSFILETYREKGDDSLQQAVLSPLCLHVGFRGVRVHAHTHTNM